LIIPTNVPRVSIITPSFNRAHLLPATVASVRAQTYGDWEMIVVDDGSNDGTLEIAQKMARVDGRIRAFPRQGGRKGTNVCRNEALALACGEYVVFLDSDDLLSPDCLERRVNRMDQSGGCQFGVYLTELFSEVVGDRKVLWNAFTSVSDLLRFLNIDVVWCVMSPIWRRQALLKLGGFDEMLPSFQDWALHTRALIAGFKYFKEPIVDNYCRHKHSTAVQISAVSISRPDHLESHEKLFIKTSADIREAGMMNQETRVHLTGLFWWLARCWLKNHDPSHADRVWRNVRKLQLCSRRHHLEGRLIIKFLPRRSEGRIAQTLQWSWPRPSHYFGSTTFFRAPVPYSPAPPVHASDSSSS
jgi:glycosyltransferase involved in cell wall biosynthesis